MRIFEAFPQDTQHILATFISIALVTLAGCGGGGGDSVSANAPPAPIVPAVGEMTLLAGTVGGVGSADGAAGRFNQPTGLATDTSGNVYVADTSNHTIRKITASGVITLAGKAGVAGYADGVGAAALFSSPLGVAVDLAGNVYVADAANRAIRKITPAGLVTTVAGTAGVPGNVDGTGAAARFSELKAITVDTNGTLFVAEYNQIRKITPAGFVTTLATGFESLISLAVDRAGNVYAVDSGASLIKKITPSGAVTAFAGTITPPNSISQSGFADGGLGVAKFGRPAGITAHSDGTLYVLDNSRIRKVTLDGVVNSLPVNKSDGTRFIFPETISAGLAIAIDGNIFVAAPTENVIRKVTPNLSVVDIAGSPVVSGNADGTGAAARFSGIGALTLDANSNIIAMDASNNALRKVTPAGVVTTRASNVHPSTDLIRQGAGPEFLRGLAVDSAGAVLLADTAFHVIRRIGLDGVTTIVAGTTWPDGVRSNGFVGTITGASKPVGVAVDSAGALFVPDGEIIRKVTTSGVDSILSCTNLPTCVAAGKPIDAITIDKADIIYAAQAGVIFKITPSAVSSTLAGGATSRLTNGTGANASFGAIRAMAADNAGNLFIADTSNNAVRKVTPAGVVTTLAGAPGAIGVVLGPLPGSLTAPAGIAVDAAGMLYVSSENAVLKIKP